MPLGLCWHLLYSEIWKWLGWAMKHTPCAKFLCVVTRKPRWWKGKTEAHGFWRWSHSCGFTSAEISKVKSSKLNDSNNGELECEESWALKNWCFWSVVLEKILESPLDCKEIQPVYPKGDQSWVFVGRTDVEAETPIFWPPDVKSWLIWKDPDAGKDWGQEKGMKEDEMVGWHHWLNGHVFGWTPGVGDG